MNGNDEKTQEIQKTIDEIWNGYNSPTQPDLALILGVTDLKDIAKMKNKYRKRSLLIHPDKFPTDNSNFNLYGQTITRISQILNRSKDIAGDTKLMKYFQKEILRCSSKNKRVDFFGLNIDDDSDISDGTESHESSKSEDEGSKSQGSEYERRKDRDQRRKNHREFEDDVSEYERRKHRDQRRKNHRETEDDDSEYERRKHRDQGRKNNQQNRKSHKNSKSHEKR
ncbi:hypothetical protein DMUE_2377 [Dictyocoela muelleri]|nr:hypothetical protein DMUE_2377 [Dictyocoela muelleri]